MNTKTIILLILGLVLALSFSAVAFAEDEGPATEPAAEEVTGPAYLADVKTDNDGGMSVLLKLSDDGEESPFYGRYFDPFEGEAFFLEELYHKGWSGHDGIVSFDITNTWDSSFRGNAEWNDINDWKMWGSVNSYDNFQIPSVTPARRQDMNFGFNWGGLDRNNLSMQYTHREQENALATGSNLFTNWETDDVNVGYTFGMLGWDSSINYNQRVLDANTVGKNDITHSTWTAKASQQATDNTYLQGTMVYKNSEVRNADDLKTFMLGGYARFRDFWGIDGMNVTSHIDWSNRSAGPSRLHPAGDLFDFDIMAKWRVSDDLKLNGGWKVSKADKTHPSRIALLELFVDPMLVITDPALLINNTVYTHKYNLGGRYDFSDNWDFSTDWNWTRRRGLDNTDVREAGSPFLWWDAELNSVYALRYSDGYGKALGNNEWVFKYTTNDRSNEYRPTSNDDSHLTVDWNGQLSDEVSAYLGGGFLRTNSIQAELLSWEQKGKEFGGGLNWAWCDNWDLFFDFWHYDVTGADGYNQSTVNTGINYAPENGWGYGLEYQTVDGDFDSLTNLDYNIKLLIFRLLYNW